MKRFFRKWMWRTTALATAIVGGLVALEHYYPTDTTGTALSRGFGHIKDVATYTKQRSTSKQKLEQNIQPLVVEQPPIIAPKDTRTVCRKAMDKVLEAKGYGVCTPLHTVMLSILHTETTGESRVNSENAVLINSGQLNKRSAWFTSKEQALDAVESLKIIDRFWGDGGENKFYTSNIDCGCFQTNWEHHSQRYNGDFASCFDADKNAAVALEILLEVRGKGGLDAYTLGNKYHRPSQNQAIWAKYQQRFKPFHDRREQSCLDGIAK